MSSSLVVAQTARLIAETHEEHHDIQPWMIGGVTLVILLLLLLGVVAFGGGREHS